MYKLKSHPKIETLVTVLGANIFNNFSSFVIIIVAARLLGQSEFSKLSLAFAVTTNLSCLLDFGTNISLVRLYNVASDSNEKINLIRAINKWKISLLIMTLCLSFPMGKLIIQTFPILEGTGLLINLSVISGGMLSSWTTIRAIEQAQKNFQAFKKYTTIYGLLRLITAVVFFLFNQISTTSVIISLYILPLLILISYKQIKEIQSYKHQNIIFNFNEFKLLKPIFSYGILVGISGILFTLMYQIPQFILAKIADAREISFYGAGLTFIPLFLLTNDAIRTIILPDVSAIKDYEGRQLFRKQLWQISPIFFGLMISALLIISCIQYFLLGEAYKASIPVFLAMGFGTLVAMYLGYSNTLIHSIGIPHLGAIINIISTIILTLLGLTLQKSAFFMSFLLGIILISGEVSTYFIVKNIDKRKV
jgi:O-antigen/teichoic acid export membrane protein